MPRVDCSGSRPDSKAAPRRGSAWSLVHGLATLWLNGNLPPQLGTDPEEITRRIAPYLTGPASRGAPD